MMTRKGIITDIKHFATHDGDGIRTTVFFKGCPLRCVWCHNPEGLSPKPEIAFYAHKCISCGECRNEGFTTDDCLGKARVLYGREVTPSSLIPELLEDRDFYESSGGGVTLSGGECLMQADFCAELLCELKKNGINTAVDTCGFVPRAAIDKVAPYTDIFLYDVKAADADVHIRCTGQSNGIIIENLKYIDSLDKSIEIRIPYVPGYNDGEMGKIGELLAPLKNLRGVRILPYHPYYEGKYAALGYLAPADIKVPAEESLAAARAELQKHLGGLVL